MASSVCRICLAGNIRMLKFYNVHLLDIFEKLTSSKFSTESDAGMPSSVCYVCHRQLQKCYMFTEMAHRSNKNLRVMLQSGIEVTYKTITKLSLAAAPTLSVTPAQFISVIDLNTTSTPVTVKEEQVKVKIEEPTDYLNVINTPAAEVVVKIEEANEFEENVFEESQMTPDTEVIVRTKNTELILKDLNDVENKETDIDSGFYCDVCNKKARSKYQLVKHLKIHTREKPYSCSKCSRSYIRKYNFESHLRIHNRKKAHLCNQCDKAFTYKSVLEIHMRSHTGERPFSCIKCGKSFSTKSDMTRHIKTHTGEKLYACMICHKAFTRNGDLTIHMRLHTGEKPYYCDICNKAFTYKSNLTLHLRRHTGKTFSCNQCDKKFSYRYAVTRHMQVHSRDKPFATNVKYL